MRPFLPLLSSLTLPAMLVACTGSDPDTPDSELGLEPASEAVAVAALTWRNDGLVAGSARSPGGATTGSGLAQLYVIEHAVGQRAAALELLSLPSAVLVLDTSLGVGECRVDRPRGDPGPIVLRDAGEVAVEGELGVSVLDSSWLPEGSLDISGVAYAGLLPAQHIAQHSPIELIADGSADVGPFSVTLAPPPLVRVLSVGRHEVLDHRVRLDERELTQHLDVVWESPAGPSAGGEAVAPPASADLTLVVFERRTFGATWTISCVAEDDGHFTIPAGALLALPDLGADRTDSVLVRRVSSASFSARHVPEGMALAVSEDQVYVE